MARIERWRRFYLPVLVIIFSLSSLVLATEVVLLFAPHLFLPLEFLFLLGLLFSVEGALVGSSISPRTPFTWRLLELFAIYLLAFLLVNIYDPRLGVAVTWSAMTDLNVLTFFGLLAFAWYLATSGGQELAGMDRVVAHLGDQKISTLSWETESILNSVETEGVTSGAKTIAARLGWFLFLTGVCVAIASGLFPERVTRLPISMVLAGLSLLVSGLLLQSHIYYYHLNLFWERSKVNPGSFMEKNWWVNSLLGTTAVVGLALIFPGRYVTYAFKWTMNIILGWLAPLFGSGFQPRFDLPTPEMPAPEPEPELPEQFFLEEEPSLLAYWAGIIFLGVVALVALAVILAIIGFIIYVIYQEERDRISGLLKIPVGLYLWFRDAFKGLRSGVNKVLSKGRKTLSVTNAPLLTRTEEYREKTLPSAPALYVRRLFLLVVRKGAKLGYPLKDSQTASEYKRSIEQKVDNKQPLDQLVDLYNQARFSGRALPDNIKDQALKAWKSVMASFNRSGGDKIE